MKNREKESEELVWKKLPSLISYAMKLNELIIENKNSYSIKKVQNMNNQY